MVGLCKAQITIRWTMAFLPDVDDGLAFEAALSFVDGYSLDALSPTSTPPIQSSVSDSLWPSEELPSVKDEPKPAVEYGGPAFTLACKEASAMVPFSMKDLINGTTSSELQLHLPTNDEPKARPKSAKAKKAPTNPNRVRDEAQYELAFLREKVAELELQLKKLQLTATPSPNGGITTALPVPRQLAQVPRVWKDMASRQRRRRDEAQRENVRLRLIVERKRKMATGLSALLRKRLTQQVLVGLGACLHLRLLLIICYDRDPSAHVVKAKSSQNVGRHVCLISKAILETSTTCFST
ncbi:unnamed protein product [Phytophthora fragariaefolia]|uniref:Unnamed protein product n=1 Tax=Phytophthora fragariaefolia TaxID=1490495 RepID=A0A9W6XV05_9STRA|nr:unnamed protein product [Phytophthora fragariaefolia]